jgi:hypothetical protein
VLPTSGSGYELGAGSKEGAAIFLLPSRPCLRPQPLPALLFSTSSPCLYYFLRCALRSSALPEEAGPRRRASMHERHYGPDWRCGTLLRQACSWAN